RTTSTASGPASPAAPAARSSRSSRSSSRRGAPSAGDRLRSGDGVLADAEDELGDLAGQGLVALDADPAVPEADHRVDGAGDDVAEVREAQGDAAVGGLGAGVDGRRSAGEVERPLAAALAFEDDAAGALEGGGQVGAVAELPAEEIGEEA